MNALDPHHWTLNSCVSAFSTISVYLGPFLYAPKLGAKGSELVGAFNEKVRATKSHRNFLQRTQLICTIGPKTQIFVQFVMFGCI